MFVYGSGKRRVDRRRMHTGRRWHSALLAVAILLVGGLAKMSVVQAQLSAAAREQARRAVEAATSGSWEWAFHLARSAGSPVLIDYLEWLRLRAPNSEAPFDLYAAFLASHPDWPSPAVLQGRAEQAMASGVGDADVSAYFADRRPVTRVGKLRLASALDGQGQHAEASRLRRSAWVEDDWPAAEESGFLSSFGDQLAPEDHVARTDRLLWNGDVLAARRMLPRVGPSWRALALARIALRTSAAGVDGAVGAVPPQLATDPGLAYERIRWRRARGMDAAARDILLGLKDDGRTDLLWAQRASLLRGALGEHQYRVAYRLAAEHGRVDRSEFADAEWTAGWIALRFLGDARTALHHFEQLGAVARTPVSLARAGYWTARGLAAAGNAAGARRSLTRASAWPATFYGQLAADELGMVLQAAPADAVPTATRRPEPPGSSYAAAALLCEIGAFDRAVPFLTRLAAGAAGTGAAGDVLALAAACGRTDLVVRAAKAMPGDDALELRYTHPIPSQRAFVDRHITGAEPALRLAVARQESQFDDGALSPSGARGLMQLMPATARAVARELGLGFSAQRLMADPDYNIRLGTHYLGRELERFDGHLAMAVAAYNAGPARVLQWVDSFGDPRTLDLHQLVDWIELIPFAETRNYVQRVLENRVVYRLLLQAPGARAIRAVPAEELPQAEERTGGGSRS